MKAPSKLFKRLLEIKQKFLWSTEQGSQQIKISNDYRNANQIRGHLTKCISLKTSLM